MNQRVKLVFQCEHYIKVLNYLIEMFLYFAKIQGISGTSIESISSRFEEQSEFHYHYYLHVFAGLCSALITRTAKCKGDVCMFRIYML